MACFFPDRQWESFALGTRIMNINLPIRVTGGQVNIFMMRILSPDGVFSINSTTDLLIIRNDSLVRELLLPDECVHRRKMGFELPFREWFAGSLHAQMQDAFCAETSEESTWPFDPSALKMLWRQFQDGRVNWSRVWSVFVLRGWLERYKVN